MQTILTPVERSKQYRGNNPASGERLGKVESLEEIMGSMKKVTEDPWDAKSILKARGAVHTDETTERPLKRVGLIHCAHRRFLI